MFMDFVHTLEQQFLRNVCYFRFIAIGAAMRYFLFEIAIGNNCYFNSRFLQTLLVLLKTKMRWIYV